MASASFEDPLYDSLKDKFDAGELTWEPQPLDERRLDRNNIYGDVEEVPED